jgi:response regulator RpfG family c-di-GMP phosphodiesterase
MAGRILFVDDEPPVLDAYKRLLHRDFDVDTALGAEQGLTSISGRGPYAVVISDMRMPGMNGAQFLARLRQSVPETVRMLLTGYTDLDAAMDAVNEGNIFRFLTKPCEKNVLTNAINAGLEQYRLVMAEKELLERTLMGSIKVLTEVLSAASPEAFGRSMRIARYVRHLVARLNLPSPWRFEAAAMLSQLGCVTLDPELIRSSCVGEHLSPEDRLRFAAHPLAAKDLLNNIPRLEPIAWMIGQQFAKVIGQSKLESPLQPQDDVVLGAKVLKLAVTLDSLRNKGLSEEEAIARLQDWRNEFGLELIGALAGLKPEATRMSLQKVSVSKLDVGMILQEEIKTRSGMLVVPKGQEVTHALLIKLDNLAQAGTIGKQIMVYAPAQR